MARKPRAKKEQPIRLFLLNERKIFPKNGVQNRTPSLEAPVQQKKATKTIQSEINFFFASRGPESDKKREPTYQNGEGGGQFRRLGGRQFGRTATVGRLGPQRRRVRQPRHQRLHRVRRRQLAHLHVPRVSNTPAHLPAAPWFQVLFIVRTFFFHSPAKYHHITMNCTSHV